RRRRHRSPDGRCARSAGRRARLMSTLLEHLWAELAALDDQALRRQRRTVDTPCTPHVTVDGRPLLAFCSNDYLGLAGDPQLVQALAAGAARWGAGAGASHLVSGHYGVHE